MISQAIHAIGDRYGYNRCGWVGSIADRFKDKIFAAAFITSITIIKALFLYQKVDGFPFNVYPTINVIIIVVSSAISAWRWKVISKRKGE